MSSAETAEWVRRKVQRELSAHVAAGIGAWASGDEDPVLGTALYEYRGTRSAVFLHERGLRQAKDGTLSVWRYEDILEVRPLSLRQLVRVRDPQRMVTIGICTGDGESSMEVPLGVYSGLCPTLVQIVERFK